MLLVRKKFDFFRVILSNELLMSKFQDVEEVFWSRENKDEVYNSDMLNRCKNNN